MEATETQETVDTDPTTFPSKVAITTADLHMMRWTRKVAKGLRTGATPSQRERILLAKTPLDVHTLLGQTLLHGSASTRRKLVKAAETRLAALKGRLVIA